MPLLEMRNICKAFSGVYANENISLRVEKGEIHALLGENGAGKTTLVNILFGLYTADSGEILWKGKPAAFRSPKEAIAAGVGMVQQHFSLVRRMTVLDNVILNLQDNRFILDRRAAEKKLTALAETYGLTVDPRARVRDLSVGEQQRVEILKALYRDVELLILDEPTGVLTPQETEQFFQVLRGLKQEGYSIIIITHRMSEIMAISDRVTILRNGRLAGELETSKTNPEELSRYMIGRELHTIAPAPRPQGEEADMLVLDGVSLERPRRGHPLHEISLRVRKGEIVGVAGVEGNGQKELAEVITGIQKVSDGSVTLDRQDLTRTSARKRYEEGIVYISDDRHNDGLVLGMTITENLVLREYFRPPYSRHTLMDRGTMEKNAQEKMADYQVRASGSSGSATDVKLLSGGNQQKLIVARELADHAKLVVASQPTRGLDIGATEFVRERLLDQRNKGRSVLLISADLEEILAVSDRIAVLFAGRIVGILDRSQATAEKIGLLMGGVTGEEDVS